MDVTETAPLLQVASSGPVTAGKGLTCRRSVIVPILVLYFCATGMNMYLVPEYTQNHIAAQLRQKQNMQLIFPGNESTVNRTQCKSDDKSNSSELNIKIQQEAAKWSMYFSVASLTPAIFTNIFCGTYSDVKGRRFVLCLCTLGMTLKLAIITVVMYYNASFVYIVVANIVEGCTGSFIACFAVTFSFSADITDPGNQRSFMIVFFEMLFGLTITISAFVTGYFIDSIGYFWTTLINTLMCAMSVVLCVTLLPETRTLQGSIQNRSMFQIVASAWKFYVKPESKLLQKKYILLLLSFAFLAMPRLNSSTLETIYQMGAPFCWTGKKISWFMTARLGTASIVGIGGVYLLQKCLSEGAIAVIGTTTGAAAFVVEGFATTNAVMYTVPAISCLAYLGFPMIRSMMSDLTPQDKQGALFAGISVVETVSTLVGALTNNMVYSATMAIMNGFVFLVLALFSFASTAILIVYMLVDRYSKHEVYSPPKSENMANDSEPYATDG